MMLNTLRSSVLRANSIYKVSSLFSQKRFFSGKELIINAVGSDRCGIVSDMTKYVTEAGGNVGESQAARLGKHFSLMMVVSIPDDKLSGLLDQLDNMSDLNASVFEASEESSSKATTTVAYSGRFILEGADNPGIVHKVASVLNNNGLSIDKMETSDELAPQGGTVLFKMVGVANAYGPLAARFDAEKIRSELDDLGHSLNCDISIEDL